MMIYIAVQLNQIFSADGRADGRTEVVLEVLANLKIANAQRDNEGNFTKAYGQPDRQICVLIFDAFPNPTQRSVYTHPSTCSTTLLHQFIYAHTYTYISDEE